MKKLLLVVLLLLLTGCSTPDTYLTVKPHTVSSGQTLDTDAVVVEDYDQLKRAILGFVERGQEQGSIHVTNYDGNVEEDLTKATYEVMKLEPLGAYAVDFMTHDCTLIVNYYEIHIDITFRRTLEQIEAVEPIATQTMLLDRLQKAAENYQPHLALRIGGYREQDFAGILLQHCRSNPDSIMEIPTVQVTVYPDQGSVRIVELTLTYEHEKEQLRNMEVAVRESVDAAAEYIRYRETDRAKAELLFTYLMERFTYVPAPTSTPVYDALCRGVADPGGMADAWQMICERAGLKCYTVHGLKNGEDYTWNILELDGQFRHLDLPACVLEDKAPTFHVDAQMSSYYWNQERFPACVFVPETTVPAPIEPLPPEEPQEPEPPQSTDPETPPAEETPQEHRPDAGTAPSDQPQS